MDPTTLQSVCKKLSQCLLEASISDDFKHADLICLHSCQLGPDTVTQQNHGLNDVDKVGLASAGLAFASKYDMLRHHAALVSKLIISWEAWDTLKYNISGLVFALPRFFFFLVRNSPDGKVKQAFIQSLVKYAYVDLLSAVLRMSNAKSVLHDYGEHRDAVLCICQFAQSVCALDPLGQDRGYKKSFMLPVRNSLRSILCLELTTQFKKLVHPKSVPNFRAFFDDIREEEMNWPHSPDQEDAWQLLTLAMVAFIRQLLRGSDRDDEKAKKLAFEMQRASVDAVMAVAKLPARSPVWHSSAAHELSSNIIYLVRFCGPKCAFQGMDMCTAALAIHLNLKEARRRLKRCSKGHSARGKLQLNVTKLNDCMGVLWHEVHICLRRLAELGLPPERAGIRCDRLEIMLERHIRWLFGTVLTDFGIQEELSHVFQVVQVLETLPFNHPISVPTRLSLAATLFKVMHGIVDNLSEHGHQTKTFKLLQPILFGLQQFAVKLVKEGLLAMYGRGCEKSRCVCEAMIDQLLDQEDAGYLPKDVISPEDMTPQAAITCVVYMIPSALVLEHKYLDLQKAMMESCAGLEVGSVEHAELSTLVSLDIYTTPSELLSALEAVMLHGNPCMRIWLSIFTLRCKIMAALEKRFYASLAASKPHSDHVHRMHHACMCYARSVAVLLTATITSRAAALFIMRTCLESGILQIIADSLATTLPKAAPNARSTTLVMTVPFIDLKLPYLGASDARLEELRTNAYVTGDACVWAGAWVAVWQVLSLAVSIFRADDINENAWLGESMAMFEIELQTKLMMHKDWAVVSVKGSAARNKLAKPSSDGMHYWLLRHAGPVLTTDFDESNHAIFRADREALTVAIDVLKAMLDGCDEHLGCELDVGCPAQFFPAILPGCWNIGCQNLSGPSEAQLKTKLCGYCRKTRYCSRECQMYDWNRHRRECTPYEEDSF